jgi:hypothetical protein
MGYRIYYKPRSACQKQSLVSTVGHILRLRQVSVSCRQNAENRVCVKICLMSWSRYKADCVAVWVSTSSHVVSFISCPSAELRQQKSTCQAVGG